MGRSGHNIEIRATSIRVLFTLDGKQRKEALKLQPTPGNVEYAKRMAAQVRKAIRDGTFDYAEFFPDSVHAAVLSPGSLSLKAACDTYIKSCGRLAKNTRDQYKNALIVWQGLLGADTQMERIKHSEIAAAVGGAGWKPKLTNNYLIPLRGVFRQFCRDMGLPNPLDGLDNSKLQMPTPDPLTGEEAQRVLTYMREHYDARVVGYFQFMFATGLRPEEGIALRWSDVDERLGQVRVERAKVAGEIKPLKTYNAREVDLGATAKSALALLEPWKKDDGEIFQNPVTERPWHDERSQRDHYWTPALKALKIRARRAYQVRHTYATLALMAGANPAYISRQMGHKNPQMLFKVYARWIDGADRGREHKKVEDALGSIIPNSSPTP